nr:TIGR00341 family protein [Pseudomonadota bacterium]
MRQLIVRVPRGCGGKVIETARRHGGANLAAVEATAGDEAYDTVIVHTPNAQVEGLLGALEPIPELHVTLLPSGVITLEPPAEQAPQQALDVQPRSPIEVFLGGLQSVGAWKGFLGYAAVSGVVVWIGLATETLYLLTAAMLIAPFAGPAMNAALASARGDPELLGRSILRYFAA